MIRDIKSWTSKGNLLETMERYDDAIKVIKKINFSFYTTLPTLSEK